MVVVKLMKLGTVSKELSFETNPTVEQVLEAASESDKSLQITRNQHCVSLDTVVYNGDVLYAAKSVKGNVFEITFMRLGGSSVSMAAEGSKTIKETLQQLGPDDFSGFYRADNSAVYEYRIGGAVVGDDHVINDTGANVRVICAKKVKGNEKKKA